MAGKTKIEWATDTWNPLLGCSVVSPGCTYCYAMKLTGTRLQHVPRYQGLTQDSSAGPVWNGTVRLVEEVLTQPLLWKRPRQIFVNSMSDLFHEAVPYEWIDKIFAIMALAPQHTFMVLTKRPDRMRAYFGNPDEPEKRAINEERILKIADAIVRPSISERVSDDTFRGSIQRVTNWPLPNVWLGISAEDQRRADERIPQLLETPAAKRFVSAEPLLGPLSISNYLEPPHSLPGRHVQLRRGEWIVDADGAHTMWRGLDWVIVGGESGHRARPMNPWWVRSIKDQCLNAGVPFLFKQWGEWVSVSEVEGPGAHHRFEDGATVRKVGKTRAGRTLDGVVYHEMP